MESRDRPLVRAILFLLIGLLVNPFLCKSKIMHALSIVLGAVAFIAWFKWFLHVEFDEGLPVSWPLVFAVPIAAYLLFLALRILVWAKWERGKNKVSRHL